MSEHMTGASDRFDPDMLKSIVGDDRSVIEELLGLYASSCAESTRRIAEGLRNRDLAMLKSAAHRLKSSSFNVGALRLSELARKLEHHVEEGGSLPGPTTAELAGLCLTEASAALSWIESLRAGEAGGED
jgi:HPt (histidine-containing phosphotransfer) domain-containing protein